MLGSRATSAAVLAVVVAAAALLAVAGIDCGSGPPDADEVAACIEDRSGTADSSLFAAFGDVEPDEALSARAFGTRALIGFFDEEEEAQRATGGSPNVERRGETVVAFDRSTTAEGRSVIRQCAFEGAG